ETRRVSRVVVPLTYRAADGSRNGVRECSHTLRMPLSSSFPGATPRWVIHPPGPGCMRSIATLVLASVLLGCTSTPSGERAVRVTRDTADVEHCKHIGAVQSVPPYAFPGDDMEQIRNRTVAIGADTVLLNASRKAATSGIAYRCRSS